MQPRQFQYLAERLAEHGAYPAEFRSAISRAYYAAFHFGLIRLTEMGLPIVQNASAHEKVYQHLNNSGDRDLIAAATKIKDLRARRIHADYRLQRRDVETKENAKMYVRLASGLMETIEKRCNSESRNQIINAIQKWRSRIPAG